MFRTPRGQLRLHTLRVETLLLGEVAELVVTEVAVETAAMVEAVERAVSVGDEAEEEDEEVEAEMEAVEAVVSGSSISSRNSLLLDHWGRLS